MSRLRARRTQHGRPHRRHSAAAAEIVALQKQMIALGMFANDRELLECPRCDQTVHEPLTDEERDEGLQA